jgi:hypothetical protein
MGGVTQEVGSGKLGVQKRGKWEYGGKKKWEVGSFVLSGKSNFAANKKKFNKNVLYYKNTCLTL